MRVPLQVETLTIDLAAYAFRSDRQLMIFCEEALKNVNVRKTLIVKGLDVHLELTVRWFPMALGMNVQPIRYDVSFRTSDSRNLGRFKSVYERLTSDSKAAEIWEIMDPCSEYQTWYSTAPDDHRVNGLDYVTDNGLLWQS